MGLTVLGFGVDESARNLLTLLDGRTTLSLGRLPASPGLCVVFLRVRGVLGIPIPIAVAICIPIVEHRRSSQIEMMMVLKVIIVFRVPTQRKRNERVQLWSIPR